MAKSKLKQTLEKVEEKVASVMEPKKEVKVVKEPVEDRSAYNCPVCKGDGIVEGASTVCANCLGTGKV